MWCNQIFSLMNTASDGFYKIENIIVADNYTIANNIAQATYGIGAIAIETTRIPVAIGDLYKDGIYYKSESMEEILPNPSEEEQIAELKSIIADLSLIQAELMLELDSQEV